MMDRVLREKSGRSGKAGLIEAMYTCSFAQAIEIFGWAAEMRVLQLVASATSLRTTALGGSLPH
jgi:hypothetical protein